MAKDETNYKHLKYCKKCGRVKKRYVRSSGKIVYNCDNCQGPIGTEGILA